MPHNTWDFSAPTRVRTHIPCMKCRILATGHPEVPRPRLFSAAAKTLHSCSHLLLFSLHTPSSGSLIVSTVPEGDTLGRPRPLTRSIALAVFGHQVCLWLFHPAAENSLG